jgi:hypothetical protein
MPKPDTDVEYVSNNSFMTSRVKVPNPFGGDYEDPLEALRANQKTEKDTKSEKISSEPTTPTIPSPTTGDFVSKFANSVTEPKPAIPSPTIPTIPSQKLEPTSPNRDFQKVSNSITREAIPSGLFGSGKAKQLYDALYSLTRGAIRPIRIVRITKPRLMKLAGIGTRQTLWLNLEHLESVGLVRKNVFLGEHGGNEYEVFIPEELSGVDLRTIPTIPTTPTSPTNRVYQVQNLEGVVGIESNPTVPSSQPINTEASDAPKTFFKDNTKTDDGSAALFSDFIEKFQAAATKLTGAQLSKYEREKWGRLADLLILELEAAARRADNPVSSLPAFLTKVLSSKLFSQKPVERKSKSNTSPDTVGKYHPKEGDDAINPKSSDELEAALCFLQEFKDDKEFLNDYKKWFVAKDWKWLIENLE